MTLYLDCRRGKAYPLQPISSKMPYEREGNKIELIQAKLKIFCEYKKEVKSSCKEGTRDIVVEENTKRIIGEKTARYKSGSEIFHVMILFKLDSETIRNGGSSMVGHWFFKALQMKSWIHQIQLQVPIYQVERRLRSLKNVSLVMVNQ